MINEQFIRSGKAIFTVSNDKGEHYTYRVNRKEDKHNPNKSVFFASLLTGPDNLSDYSYMGLLDASRLKLILTKGSKVNAATTSVKVFQWALHIIAGRIELPEGYNIQHAGRCGKCAKTLTDPISVEIGIGPECRKQMGIEA